MLFRTVVKQVCQVGSSWWASSRKNYIVWWIAKGYCHELSNLMPAGGVFQSLKDCMISRTGLSSTAFNYDHNWPQKF